MKLDKATPQKSKRAPAEGTRIRDPHIYTFRSPIKAVTESYRICAEDPVQPCACCFGPVRSDELCSFVQLPTLRLTYLHDASALSENKFLPSPVYELPQPPGSSFSCIYVCPYHACMSICIYVHIYMHTCTCMCTHMYTHLYVYTHTYM